MKKRFVLSLTISLLFVVITTHSPISNSQTTKQSVVIVNYRNKDSICHRPDPRINIKTTIPQYKINNIYLLVKPVLVDEYWVQPALTKDTQGNWHVTPYIGKEPASNIFEKFEMIVLINTQPLKTGQKLGQLPKAEFQSLPTTVIKKRC